jgi:hypothetical protein
MKALVIIGLVLQYGVTQCQGEPHFDITLDEWGYGTTGDIVIAWTNFLSGGGVQYRLPFTNCVAGDVLIYDTFTHINGDLIRFYNTNIVINGTPYPFAYVIFYSLLDDLDNPTNPPADIDPLPQYNLNKVEMTNEWGLADGSQVAYWNPGRGHIGDIIDSNTNLYVIYTFISDKPVPEPSIMALVGLGLVGLAFKVYRRRSK